MYSPAALPSRMRAAPAKKRRLSAENGISSRAPRSACRRSATRAAASSSAFSSITSASLSSSLGALAWRRLEPLGQRLLRGLDGTIDVGLGSPRGTSAIVSPVAGFSTSIVPPSTASTHSPPTKFFCWETVTLIENLPFEIRESAY